MQGNVQEHCDCDGGRRPFRPNYLSELFGKFLADNDLPKIVLHELRHTFASLSNQAGIPAYNIGKALGHSTPATTQKIYTHLLDQTHTQALKAWLQSRTRHAGRQARNIFYSLRRRLLMKSACGTDEVRGTATSTWRKSSQSEGDSSAYGCGSTRQYALRDVSRVLRHPLVPVYD